MNSPEGRDGVGTSGMVVSRSMSIPTVLQVCGYGQRHVIHRGFATTSGRNSDNNNGSGGNGGSEDEGEALIKKGPEGGPLREYFVRVAKGALRDDPYQRGTFLVYIIYGLCTNFVLFF